MEQQVKLSLSHSVKACRKLTSLAHSNFAPAFALLPAKKRQAMEILYAYSRFADDLVDFPDFSPEGVPLETSLERKKQKLSQWISAVEAVLGRIGEENVPQIDPHDEKTFLQIAQQFPDCGGIVVLPALKMIVDEFQIPREPLFHLIDGVESDLEPKPFATFDDCANYCHQVATSVGFASLAIWGTSEPLFSETVVKAAKACGIAFQWTNIVRDLLEDYRNGRIYLPQSELQRFGLTEKQFGSILDGAAWAGEKKPPKKGNDHDYYAHQNKVAEMSKFDEKFFKLISYQLNRCEVYYGNSQPLYHLIHKDSRRAFGLMWNYYHTLYRMICQNPLRVTKNERIRLSLYRKSRLWFHWRYMPCRRLG